MIEYRLARTRNDLKNIFSFRQKVYTVKKSNQLISDEYDGLPETLNFSASSDGVIFACARLILGRKSLGMTGLPSGKYSQLDPSRHDDRRVAEFSRLVVSEDTASPELLLAFIIHILERAVASSVGLVCTLINTGTDDNNSVTLIYKIAQIRNLVQPLLQPAPDFKPSVPEKTDHPLYRSRVTRSMNKQPLLNYHLLQKLEKQGVVLPYSLQLYTRIGFRFGALPVFLTQYGFYGIPMILEIDKKFIKEFSPKLKQIEEPLVPVREVNCRTANSVIQYVLSQKGDSDGLLQGIPYSKEYLTDENNWIDCKSVIRIFHNARILLNDSQAAYQIGRLSGKMKSIGLFNTLYKLFSNPLTTIKMVARYSHLWNRIQEFSTIVINPHKVHLIMSKPAVLPSEEICEFNRGICASVPELWNLKATVLEIECVRKGDPCCKYEIQWEKSKSIFHSIYNETIDRLKTWGQAWNIIHQKNELVKRKNIELKEINEKNLRLNILLEQENAKLREKLKHRLDDLKKIYERKSAEESEIHNQAKESISDHLSVIVAHEIKSNISSLDLLIGKLKEKRFIETNQSHLGKILELARKNMSRENFKAVLDLVDGINSQYGNIEYTVRALAAATGESISLCKCILENSSNPGEGAEDIGRIFDEFTKQKNEEHGRDIVYQFRSTRGFKAGFKIKPMRTLLENLCRNAEEAVRNSVPGRQKRISVKLRRSRSRTFQLSVCDNGPGISSGIRQKIFEPFFTTNVKNLGLGLAFCKKITDLYHGSIRVKSRPGKTEFLVRLPMTV